MLGSVSRTLLRARPVMAAPLARPLGFTAVRYSSGQHGEETETYEAFNARYATFFSQVKDTFELERGLNNSFAYDLVPSTEVIEQALRAARRVNSYEGAVRILSGVKIKVENEGQYKAYLTELKPIIEELGITTEEELYKQ
ncbi:hypothetical protein IAT38_000456 [Cryptococcus sp. DSM 104549]